RNAGAIRPFDLLERQLQRLGGRRAAPAVLVARAVRQKIFGARIEHRGGVIDRRIDETVVGFRIAPGGDHAGSGPPRRRGRTAVLTGVVHAGVSSLPQTSPITPLPRQCPLSSTP